jgi:DNA-binding NarL/FixJ family response regulator
MRAHNSSKLNSQVSEANRIMGHARVPGGGRTRRRGGRRKVLLVEDDYLIALFAESCLLDAGYEVIGVAATAEKAVALSRKGKPELAIMDIRLIGERDGIAAARELLSESGLRCLFVTAHNDSATRRRAEAARPLGWLAKPYQPEALVRAVKEAFAEIDGPH